MQGNMPMYERIRKYIDDRDVSRKIIAMNVGFSESQLSLLLNGKRRLSVDEYEKICGAMAVDPRYFYSDIPIANQPPNPTT